MAAQDSTAAPAGHGDPVLTVRPLMDQDAEVIRAWHYPGPYGVYDIPSHGPLPSTDDGYWAVVDKDDIVVGYLKIGDSARVTGVAPRDDTVDMYVGLDPARVGRGDGKRLANAALAWLGQQHPGKKLRSAIHSWNIRALRVFRHYDFGQESEVLCREGPSAVRYTIVHRRPAN